MRTVRISKNAAWGDVSGTRLDPTKVQAASKEDIDDIARTLKAHSLMEGATPLVQHATATANDGADPPEFQAPLELEISRRNGIRRKRAQIAIGNVAHFGKNMWEGKGAALKARSEGHKNSGLLGLPLASSLPRRRNPGRSLISHASIPCCCHARTRRRRKRNPSPPATIWASDLSWPPLGRREASRSARNNLQSATRLVYPPV